MLIKSTRIQSQFPFLMENSMVYAKITVSQKKCFETQHLKLITIIIS